MEHEDIIAIVKLFDRSSCGELTLQVGSTALTLRKSAGPASVATPTATHPTPAPVAPSQPVPAMPRPKAAVEFPPGAVVIHSPMVGTFYRAPAPGAAPFIEIGAVVDAEATIGIIEVMKVMNTIKAGQAGRILAIPAENGGMVEFGQPIAVIDPAG